MGEKEGFQGRECLFNDSQILEDEENNSSLSILAWICHYPESLIIAQNKVNGTCYSSVSVDWGSLSIGLLLPSYLWTSSVLDGLTQGRHERCKFCPVKIMVYLKIIP